MKRASVVNLVLLASLLLAACSSTPADAPTSIPTAVPTPLPDPTALPATDVPEPSPAPSATPSGVTLIDALGRSVHFDQLPQRIAITGRASVIIVDTIYMFPGASQRVSVLPQGGQIQDGGFIAVVDPAYDQKLVLDRDAGPEQVAAAQPDAVVLKSYLADSLGAAFEQIGIPVVYVDLETAEQYERDILILGQLLGDEAHAAEIVDYYRSQQEQITQVTNGLTAEQKPRVLLLQYSDRGGEVAFNVPPAAWIQTLMVEQAGGTAVWKEAAEGGGWAVVNFEQIAAWDPDQIFIVNYFSNVDETVAGLTSDPQWQVLRAVREGQVHAFPKDFYSWDQPDPRWLLGMTWLATKIHPDRFAEIDMTQQTFEFFKRMYGLDESAIREQILSRLEGDLD